MVKTTKYVALDIHKVFPITVAVACEGQKTPRLYWGDMQLRFEKRWPSFVPKTGSVARGS